MSVLEHWPQPYKDLYLADSERKRPRLIDQTHEAHRLGLFDDLKRNAALKKAATLRDVDIFGAVVRMHKLLRVRKVD